MRTAEGHEDDDRDDVDARFAALIRDDFGAEVGPAREAERRPLAPPAGRGGWAREIPEARRPGPRDADVSTFDAWDLADAELDEREGVHYTPRALPPMRRWTALASVGALLATVGLLVSVLAVFVALPGWATALAMLALVVGLSALIVAALRRRGDHDTVERDENGAVV